MVSAIQTVISVLFRLTKHCFSAMSRRVRLFRHDIAGKKHPVCIPRTCLPDSIICKHLFFHLLDDYEKMVDDIRIGINFCRLPDADLALLPASYPDKDITARKHDKGPFI
jgi:hypothetical protein